MHKILSVRFLLKFTHFLLGLRCRYGFFFFSVSGKFAFSVPLCQAQWIWIGSPAVNRAQIQTQMVPDPTRPNPITRVAIRKCENVKMCNVQCAH